MLPSAEDGPLSDWRLPLPTRRWTGGVSGPAPITRGKAAKGRATTSLPRRQMLLPHTRKEEDDRMRRDDVKEELLASNAEFRRLYEEHRDYDSRLNNLQSKAALSAEDELEAKRIKVHKLQLKDRMEIMIRDHERAVTA